MATISKIATKAVVNTTNFDTGLEKMMKAGDKFVNSFKPSKGVNSLAGLRKALESLQSATQEPKTLLQIESILTDIAKGDGIAALEKAKKLFADIADTPGMKPLGFDKLGSEIGKLKNAQPGRIVSGLQSVKSAAVSTRAIVGALVATFATYVGLGKAADYLFDVQAAMIQTLRTADRLGTSATKILAIQHAVRLTGRNIDDATESFEHFVGLVQKAKQGDLVARHALRGLSNTVDQLNAAGPSLAFEKVIEDLHRIVDPAQQATKAFQIFGDKAGEIIPLIQGGARGLQTATEKARQLGLAITDLELRKLEQGVIAFDEMTASVRGLALQVAANIGPVVMAAVQAIKNMIPANMNMADSLQWVGKVAAYVFSVVWNTVIALKSGFLLAKAGVLGIARAMVMAFEQIAIAAGAVAAAFNKNELADSMLKVAQELSNSRGEIDKQLAETRKSFEENNKKTFEAGEAEGIMAGLLKSISSQVTLIGNAQAKVAQAAARNGVLMQEGLSVFAEHMSPLEQFTNRFNKLNEMLAIGAIDANTYGRAINRLLGELEDAQGMNEIRLPSAVRRDSVDAASAINRARLEAEQRNATPQQRIESAVKQGNTIAQQSKDYLREIANAAQATRIVIQIP